MRKLTEAYRDTPSMTGQLAETVWHDIVVALSKDVPEAAQLARKQV
jgi:hypothetical protein